MRDDGVNTFELGAKCGRVVLMYLITQKRLVTIGEAEPFAESVRLLARRVSSIRSAFVNLIGH